MPRMTMLRRTRTIRAASLWKSFVVKKGSVFTMTLRDQITDQLKSRFSAVYDPRIAGVYLQIESLNCGWGKVEEIRRHIWTSRNQASFVRGVLEKIGVGPQVERIGKSKSAGDQLARTTMSEQNCEMLTALLDNTYGNWPDIISSTRGKKREDIEKFVDEGVYQVEKLKEEGWITNIQYDDEVTSMLKERLGVQKEKKLPMVDYW